MVVNTKADRQHEIASALELLQVFWRKEVDFCNVGGHMANIECQKLAMLLNEACLFLNNGRIKTFISDYQ